MVAKADAERRAEIARRGQEAFERHVRPKLGPEDENKYVAIDIETGDYEIDADDYIVCRRMRDRYPAERLWLVRVGHRAAATLRTPRLVVEE
jgi:hypothetical protein